MKTGFRKDNPDSRIPTFGQYGKDARGHWFGCTPDGFMANLSKHDVVEHPDGTITVSPSILVTAHDGSWHGYLKEGVWNEC